MNARGTINEILELAEDIGLEVRAFVCDRGGASLQMAKKFGKGVFKRKGRDGSMYEIRLLSDYPQIVKTFASKIYKNIIYTAQHEKLNLKTPMLSTIFDKALQNPSQVALLSEATCAACIILKTDILPSMLVGLSDPDPEVAENTLDGLRQVMSIKSRVVLPYLVPQLTAPPVNAKALSILVSVAVEALTKYLEICSVKIPINARSHIRRSTPQALLFGCLGALLKYLSTDQVDDVLRHHVVIDDNDDSSLKHGRTVVIFVGLKESATTILNTAHHDSILKVLITNISLDKVQIAGNGIRGATYLIEYWMINKLLPAQLIVTAFTSAMNYNSNDIKQLVTKSCNHMAKTLEASQISPEIMRYLIPMLVNGTKEKNGYVKSNAVIALISMLSLRDDETTYSKVCDILDAGARDSLNEVVSKVLRKAAIQPAGKDEEFDDTLLI
uniref:Stalled ribosome sensor GCN1-like HEAT repeats region domain-containing protein n=1 Tax=Glossina palpalis gambiensis TaxID=67801 RepID=A0A1B0BT70_9MUSC